jgi:hypothetical protein
VLPGIQLFSSFFLSSPSSSSLHSLSIPSLSSLHSLFILSSSSLHPLDSYLLLLPILLLTLLSILSYSTLCLPGEGHPVDLDDDDILHAPPPPHVCPFSFVFPACMVRCRFEPVAVITKRANERSERHLRLAPHSANVS